MLPRKPLRIVTSRWLLVILLGSGATSLPIAAHAQDVEHDRIEVEAAEDRDRDLELFWVSAGAGLQILHLRTFQADDTMLSAGLVPTQETGPAASLSLGLRFLPLTLGARGSVSFFEDSSVVHGVRRLQLWSIDGELTVRLVPRFVVEPYLLFGGGYTELTGLEDVLGEVGEEFEVRGPNIRVGLGLDYFASHTFSIGALFSADLLLLSRPGASVTSLMQPERVETVGEAKARVLEGDGLSLGVAYAFVIAPALHFD